MSQERFHQDQIKHNEAFYKDISSLPSQYLDWMTTVIFYIAVHYVDTFLCNIMGAHPGKHEIRNRFLSNLVINGTFSNNFWISYKRLYNSSRIARYMPDIWKRRIDSSKIQLYLQDLDVIKNRK